MEHQTLKFLFHTYSGEAIYFELDYAPGEDNPLQYIFIECDYKQYV